MNALPMLIDGGIDCVHDHSRETVHRKRPMHQIALGHDRNRCRDRSRLLVLEVHKHTLQYQGHIYSNLSCHAPAPLAISGAYLIKVAVKEYRLFLLTPLHRQRSI